MKISYLYIKIKHVFKADKRGFDSIPWLITMSKAEMKTFACNPQYRSEISEQRKHIFRITFFSIDLVTVSDAILTGRQTRLEIQCLYGNPMSNYFHQTLSTRQRILQKKKRNVAVLESIHSRFEFSIHLSVMYFPRTSREHREMDGKFKTRLDAF